MRRSTGILIAIFVIALATYILVRPEPAAAGPIRSRVSCADDGELAAFVLDDRVPDD